VARETRSECCGTTETTDAAHRRSSSRPRMGVRVVLMCQPATDKEVGAVEVGAAAAAQLSPAPR